MAAGASEHNFKVPGTESGGDRRPREESLRERVGQVSRRVGEDVAARASEHNLNVPGTAGEAAA